MNSKRKGNAGESEVLHILQQHGYQACRNDQTFVGGMERPDISLDLNGIRFHVEVKRQEHLRLHEAMDQAIRDANGKAVPVVIHRRNREPWQISMLLDDWLICQGRDANQ